MRGVSLCKEAGKCWQRGESMNRKCTRACHRVANLLCVFFSDWVHSLSSLLPCLNVCRALILGGELVCVCIRLFELFYQTNQCWMEIVKASFPHFLESLSVSIVSVCNHVDDSSTWALLGTYLLNWVAHVLIKQRPLCLYLGTQVYSIVLLFDS